MLSFDHISIDEGLSFPVVKCILKDRYVLDVRTIDEDDFPLLVAQLAKTFLDNKQP